MQRYKPYVLPVAILAGLLFHTQAMLIAWLVPYLIFAVLFINFTAVDLRRLGFNRLDLFIMVFQTFGSLGAYFLVKAVSGNDILADGALIGVLCPVASAVVVVASALGADRRITTGYTIYGNMLVAVLAPIYFSFIGVQRDMPFVESATRIFMRVAAAIALPYFLALALQLTVPRLTGAVSRAKEWTLVLWGISLMLVIGQTIDYIYLDHAGNEAVIAWLAVIALITTVVQFGIGRIIGRRIGQPVAATQLMGQKNTAIGIWMAGIYLSPLSSVVLAFYAIFQNIWNSYQLWHYRKTTST